MQSILSDADDRVSKEMNNNYLMLNKKHLEAMKLDQQQQILDFKHEGLCKIATNDQTLVTSSKKTLGKATFSKSHKSKPSSISVKGKLVSNEGVKEAGKTQKQLIAE